MSDASLQARAQIVKEYSERLKQDYAHLENLRFSSAGMTVESFKLVLLPVWLTEIYFKGKNHPILINGQNGSVRDQMKNYE